MKRGPKPKYPTEEALQAKIEGYFAECDEKKKLPNKAGLRVYLDIVIDTMLQYKKKYPTTIKKAYGVIEDAWVQRLTYPGSGPIFYLKNAYHEDYKDRMVTDMTIRTPRPLLDALHNKRSNKKDRSPQ